MMVPVSALEVRNLEPDLKWMQPDTHGPIASVGLKNQNQKSSDVKGIIRRRTKTVLSGCVEVYRRSVSVHRRHKLVEVGGT